MRTALLSLTFLLAGSMAAPAFAHTAAPKKKVTATTKKGKILPMKEYVDKLMDKMTLQEKIGLSVSGFCSSMDRILIIRALLPSP